MSWPTVVDIDWSKVVVARVDRPDRPWRWLYGGEPVMRWERYPPSADPWADWSSVRMPPVLMPYRFATKAAAVEALAERQA